MIASQVNSSRPLSYFSFQTPITSFFFRRGGGKGANDKRHSSFLPKSPITDGVCLSGAAKPRIRGDKQTALSLIEEDDVEYMN